MKTVAVTGSSGFIGRHLVNRLCQNKLIDVFEIDINKGHDLTDWNKINILPPFDVIVHLAAKSFVPESFNNPREFYHNNLIATVNTLELARKNSASYIYISSYLYGEPEYLPINENHPLKPHNPYAQTKLVCENICQGYYRDFKVPVTIFRPFNIYGPGQNPLFLLPKILQKLKTGKITLNDPRPKRDYLHVNDVVNAISLSIQSSNDQIQIYNLGTGKSHSVEQVVKMIMNVYKINAEITYSHDYREGEVLNSIADIGKVYEMLHWEPAIRFIDGLKTLDKMEV